MKVVIVGAKERDTIEDRDLVCRLVEKIAAEAPRTIFVGSMTHVGVGRFLKDKCLEHDPVSGRYRYVLVDCSVRVFAQGLSKADMSQIFLARNATPLEIGDLLIYLASEDRRGTCEDLVDRFVKAGRPVVILAPGEPLPESIFDVPSEA